MAKEKKEIKKTTKAEKATKKTDSKAKAAPKKAVKAEKTTPAKAVKAVKATKVEAEKKAEPKKAPVKKSAEPKEDTGSVSFQINNFSEKIKSLAKHLKTHPHDFDSRRGLLIMVGKRRRLLNYLKKSDVAEYEEVAKGLKLKA